MKDFVGWHKEKQFLDNSTKQCFPQPGDIWNVKLGINIGCEENGKGGYIRPCLVIKKIGSLYFVIPCTTQGKDDNRFYQKITSLDFVNVVGEPLTSYIMISHARTIAINRFVRSKGSLSPEEFYDIKKLLQRVYF